jgi:hypothetical protein
MISVEWLFSCYIAVVYHSGKDVGICNNLNPRKGEEKAQKKLRFE